MIERLRERRKILWAILASVFLHLLVAYSLAAFSAAFTPPPIPEIDEKPPEMTLVDVVPAAPKEKNPGYTETSPENETQEKPKDQTFESNANSIAATEHPTTETGDLPLPSQNGKEQPFMNLQTQQYAAASEGAKAQPPPQPASTPRVAEANTPAPTATASVKPSQTPPVTPTPPPVTTPEPEQLAMLRATPPPPLKAPDEAETAPTIAPESRPLPTQRPQPERPSSDFRAQKEQTRITGTISNRGRPSVNAVGTPMGRYQKAVSDAIGARWYYFMKGKIDLVSIGTAHVSAEITPDGRIQNLRVLSNNANEAFANICLQSFEEAKLPPIPTDVVTLLPDGRMPVDIFFTTYAQ